MPSTKTLHGAFGLETQYREYVWGGNRLRPGQTTAEAWVVYEGDTIATGPLAGRTLAEAAQEYGAALLGERVTARTGTRFPLLIKLLDCAQWLSLQVHPDDRQAEQLEGLGKFGKTEAWHILQADPAAEILCGFKPGVAEETWKQAVREGSLLELTQHVNLRTGDTVFIRPGTLHALGPGLLVYEVQQTSDITYRVWDWNRPLAAGRKLHIEQSLAVLDPHACGQAIPQPEFSDGSREKLVSSQYFTLEMLMTETAPLRLDPGGQTFHILTAIDGPVDLVGDGWKHTLEKYASAVVPASSSAYALQASSRARVLKASVEE